MMRSSLWTQTLAPRCSCLQEGDFPPQFLCCYDSASELTKMTNLWPLSPPPSLCFFLPLFLLDLYLLSSSLKKQRETFPRWMKALNCPRTVKASVLLTFLTITCRLFLTFDLNSPSGLIDSFEGVILGTPEHAASPP